jgi:O-antigen ligase
MLLSWQTLPAVILIVLALATRQGTASIVLLVGLAIVGILEPTRLRIIRGLAVIVLAVIIAMVFLLVLPQVSDQMNFSHRAENLETRRAVWAAAEQVWPTLSESSRAFGQAAGQFPRLVVKLDARIIEWTAQLHSMYYQMAFAIGYVGLAAYATVLLGLSLVTFLRTVGKAQTPAYPFAFAVMTIIFGYSYDVRADLLFGLMAAAWWTRPHFARSPHRSISGRASQTVEGGSPLTSPVAGR